MLFGRMATRAPSRTTNRSSTEGSLPWRCHRLSPSTATWTSLGLAVGHCRQYGLLEGSSGVARNFTVESLPFVVARQQFGLPEGAGFVASELDSSCCSEARVVLASADFSLIYPLTSSKRSSRWFFSGWSVRDVREACLQDNSDRCAIAFRGAKVTQMRHLCVLGVFWGPSMTNSGWSSTARSAGVSFTPW